MLARPNSSDFLHLLSLMLTESQPKPRLNTCIASVTFVSCPVYCRRGKGNHTPLLIVFSNSSASHFNYFYFFYISFHCLWLFTSSLLVYTPASSTFKLELLLVLSRCSLHLPWFPACHLKSAIKWNGAPYPNCCHAHLSNVYLQKQCEQK